MLRNRLLSTVLFAAAAAPAWGQDGNPFVLDAGKIELPALIDRAATYLGRNILYDEADLVNSCPSGAAITLQQPVQTDPNGCEDLLTTLLYTKGFAVVTRDPEKKIYELIWLNGPRAHEVFNTQEHKTPEEILARPALVVPVMTVVELKHTDAMVAYNSLRPFFFSSGALAGRGITLGTAGNGSTLLISGMQNSVANAIRILRNCDVPRRNPPASSIDQRIGPLEQRIAALEKELAKLTGKGAGEKGR